MILGVHVHHAPLVAKFGDEIKVLMIGEFHLNTEATNMFEEIKIKIDPIDYCETLTIKIDVFNVECFRLLPDIFFSVISVTFLLHIYAY